MFHKFLQPVSILYFVYTKYSICICIYINLVGHIFMPMFQQYCNVYLKVYNLCLFHITFNLQFNSIFRVPTSNISEMLSPKTSSTRSILEEVTKYNLVHDSSICVYNLKNHEIIWSLIFFSYCINISFDLCNWFKS